jgi:hypothetical protein
MAAGISPIVGGHFALPVIRPASLLGMLPPIVRIRKESDKAALRWSVKRDDAGAARAAAGRLSARRFLDAMHDRLGEFALSLHPDKTRSIEFGRFAANDRKLRGLGKPETFAFLGFTFICGRSRRGNFQPQRKTRRDRMRGKLRDILGQGSLWCRWPP